MSAAGEARRIELHLLGPNPSGGPQGGPDAGGRDGPPAPQRPRSRLAQARARNASELAVAAGAAGESSGAGDAFAGVERGGAENVFASECGREARAKGFVGRASVAADAVGWEGRDGGGEGLGLGARAAAGHDAVGQADGGRFTRVDRPAGQDDIERTAEADQRRQAHRAAVDERNAPTAVEDTHDRVLLDDAEVAPEREL